MIIKTFEEFIFENQIFEANFGSKRVCIFPGRFQPFHLGHIASLKRTSEIFNLPVVPIQIKSKNEDSPFDDGLLMKIGQAVAKEYGDWMAGYCLYPPNLKTVVPQMVNYLRGQYGFESIGLGCGSDREKDYTRQIAYLNSDKSDVPVIEPFRLEVVSVRTTNEISGTKVRQAIREGNMQLFKESTPQPIHKFYNELKKQLG